MKKVLTAFFLLATLISFNSCRTKDGAPGPAGTSGTNGTNGTNGLVNQGSVSGTLSYLDYQGDSVGIPFNYPYYATLQTNQFWYYGPNSVNNAPGYQIDLSRRGITDGDDSTSFQLYGSLDNSGNPVSPNSASISFSLMEDLNNSLFSFQASDSDVFDSNYNSNIAVTNFSLDTLSGQLKFNYVLTLGSGAITSPKYNNSTKPAVITGSVNVILVRNKYIVFYPLPS
jgi:hypothetical protein